MITFPYGPYAAHWIFDAPRFWELAIESVKHFRAWKCWEIPEENGHLSTYLASYPSIYLSIHPPIHSCVCILKENHWTRWPRSVRRFPSSSRLILRSSRRAYWQGEVQYLYLWLSIHLHITRMYIYIYTCMCIYPYIHIYISTYLHISTYLYMYISIYLYI